MALRCFEIICAPVCRFELLPDVCKVLHDKRLVQLTRHDARGAQLQEDYERVRPHLGNLGRATLEVEVTHGVQAIAEAIARPVKLPSSEVIELFEILILHLNLDFLYLCKIYQGLYI